MKNLAGKPDRAEETNHYVREELERCGIDVVVHEDLVPHSEVPTNLTGKLGSFKFTRAWYYWVVEGNVPLEVAEKLYADPVGKKDIRVGGHCGCPSPTEYGTKYFDVEGRELINDPDGKQEKEWDDMYARGGTFVRETLSPEKKATLHFVPSLDGNVAKAFVDGYHIDSELGLYIFVKTLKDAGLV